MGGGVLCGSSAYFGYTPVSWSTFSILRRAEIRQSPILRHRPSERSSAGSAQPSSCVVCGRTPIRTSSDLMVAMFACVRSGAAHVEVVRDRRAAGGILIARQKRWLVALCVLTLGLLPLVARAQITEPLLPLLPNPAPPEAPQARAGSPA